eukprot:4307408-Pyramimonas_sp.AAC.1
MSATSRQSNLIGSMRALSVVSKARVSLACTKEQWNGPGGRFSSVYINDLVPVFIINDCVA